MKKYFCLIVFIFFSVSFLPKADALNVSAQYACVIDGITGRVLFEKNAYEKHSMASTTKIMTALIALENGNKDDIVTVSKNAAGTEGSSIYLKQGEKITLCDLLYGLMLSSGNDAAIAIAEHVGGSVENFADMMTKKAKEIGAKNTSFKNPNGLDEDGHYTTAYDLALITRTALANETFREIVSTKTKNISNGEESYMRTLTNHNKLLRLYPGCIGVKTGFTKKTGRCLVSAAEKDNSMLIAVTLNAPDDWNDHTNMLNYGFENSKAEPLIIKDMVMKTLPVKDGETDRLSLVAADNIFLNLGNDGLQKLSLDYKIPSNVTAPIKKGTQLGSVTVGYEGKNIKEIPLVAAADIPYKEAVQEGFLDKLKFIISKIFS